MIPSRRLTYPDCFDTGVVRVLSYARGEIIGRNQDLIDVGHIMMGIVRYEEASQSGVLRSMGCDLMSMRRWLLFELGEKPGPYRIKERRSFTVAARLVLSWAVEMARRSGATTVCPEYLLLATLDADDALIERLVNTTGIKRDQVLQTVAMRNQVDPATLSAGQEELFIVLPCPDTDMPAIFDEDIERMRKEYNPWMELPKYWGSLLWQRIAALFGRR